MIGLAAMGDTVTQRLGALVDFGLANVTLIIEMFGVCQVFNGFSCFIVIKYKRP